MRKHLLSVYGDFCKSAKMIDSGKTTCETSTVEATGADEFLAVGVTYETRSQENSDADEFFLKGPTNLTFTQENTDADEFLPDVLGDFNNRDFDEILLI